MGDPKAWAPEERWAGHSVITSYLEDGGWEGGDGREEMGGRRWEGGDGREGMGGREWEGGDGKVRKMLT